MTSELIRKAPVNNLRHRRKAACLAVASVSLLLAAPAVAKDKPAKAHAPAKAEAVVSGCADRVFSKVFSAFNDRALYTLAGDGGFETGAAGWERGVGASVGEESSSILLGDALGATSLELAPGATATTPAICVAKGYPSFGFATRSAERGVLRVQVLYANGKAKKAGRVKAGDAWKVTRKLSLAQGRFRTKRAGVANVQLKFTASRGTVRMDDLYVDPRFRR
jgi:hypothetical protein